MKNPLPISQTTTCRTCGNLVPMTRAGAPAIHYDGGNRCAGSVVRAASQNLRAEIAEADLEAANRTAEHWHRVAQECVHVALTRLAAELDAVFTTYDQSSALYPTAEPDHPAHLRSEGALRASHLLRERCRRVVEAATGAEYDAGIRRWGQHEPSRRPGYRNLTPEECDRLDDAAAMVLRGRTRELANVVADIKAAASLAANRLPS